MPPGNAGERAFGETRAMAREAPSLAASEMNFACARMPDLVRTRAVSRNALENWLITPRTEITLYASCP
jgi:hypothetical protein